MLTLNTAEPNWTSGVCPLNSGTNKTNHKTSTDPARAAECVVSFTYILIPHTSKDLRNWSLTVILSKQVARISEKGAVLTCSRNKLFQRGLDTNLKATDKEIYTIPIYMLIYTISISDADLLFVSTKNLISSSETRMVFSNRFLLKRHLKGCCVQQKCSGQSSCSLQIWTNVASIHLPMTEKNVLPLRTWAAIFNNYLPSSWMGISVQQKCHMKTAYFNGFWLP